MTQWTLEKAKNGFSEVVRRALVPRPLTEYLAASPLAKAVAEGAFGCDVGDPFPRDRDIGRDIDFE